MAPTAEKDFEVWGDPIEHSLSPTLHRAAYAALGRNWSYRARTVTKELITPAWVGAGARLGGISLTMPLKERILDLVALRDPIVDVLLCVGLLRQSKATPPRQDLRLHRWLIHRAAR